MPRQGYIDIHCHIIPYVDDGATNMEVAEQMIAHAAEEGITDIIATPHYRHGMFDYPQEEIMAYYSILREIGREHGVRLYLGCEYYVDGEIFDNLKNHRIFTLAGSSFVLTEYSPAADFAKVRTFSQGLLRQGYTPVIAHIERIDQLVAHPERVKELSDMGVYMQVNADSIMGHAGFGRKRFTHKLLKQGLVDFVASDGHNMIVRRPHLSECAEYISRKFGDACSDSVCRGEAVTILKRNM